jgi:hypothetical protein
MTTMERGKRNSTLEELFGRGKGTAETLCSKRKAQQLLSNKRKNQVVTLRVAKSFKKGMARVGITAIFVHKTNRLPEKHADYSAHLNENLEFKSFPASPRDMSNA